MTRGSWLATARHLVEKLRQLDADLATDAPVFLSRGFRDEARHLLSYREHVAAALDDTQELIATFTSRTDEQAPKKVRHR